MDFKCTIQDSLAEWSKALASGASPQGRGLEPHSCQLAHKRQRAQLHVDRARSALLASSGSCPQQNKGEMCCLSVFYPGCLVDMSSPASMPAVVSSRKLQCCCCSSEHDSLAEWSKALASGASPQGRWFEPHSCHCCLLAIVVIQNLWLAFGGVFEQLRPQSVLWHAQCA